MNKGNEHFFDKFAETYRDIHTKSIRGISGADSFYFAAYKVKELVNFEDDGNKNFLDFGCGDGVTEYFLNQYFPSFNLIGIDVSEKSIDEAKRKQLQNSFFTSFDGCTIPYPDSNFDIVFAAGVFHHIKKPLHYAIVKEIYRVLKPGGRFYLFEHNPLNPFTQHLVKTCEFDKDVNLLRSGYCKSLLAQNNFLVKETNYTIFFPRKKWCNALLKFEKYLKRIPFGGQYYIRSVKPVKH